MHTLITHTKLMWYPIESVMIGFFLNIFRQPHLKHIFGNILKITFIFKLSGFSFKPYIYFDKWMATIHVTIPATFSSKLSSLRFMDILPFYLFIF